jgi:hypothetical protein
MSHFHRFTRLIASFAPFLARPLIMLFSAVLMLPIILGAVTESENIRKEQYKAMREEHRRRIAIERQKLEERRQAIAIRKANSHNTAP